MAVLVGSVLFAVLLYVTLSKETENELIRQTVNGLVQGNLLKTVDGNTSYLRFVGIPYAEPPIGDLRFKAPQRPKNWMGILKATNEKNICTQHSNASEVIGSEDCLFINVYVPKIYKSAPLPVVLWIHGGGFTIGDSNYGSYGPDYFLDENVLVVTFNYRLGIFGFFSTEDENASGNFGLKDQILALRWVHENVEFFGGDPKNVTIFGESAGAAAVSYLLLVPSIDGLYKGAILNSGNSLCQWALSTWAREIAFKIGKHFNITTNESNVLVHELRKIEHGTLQEVAAKISNLSSPYNLVFSPVAEPHHPDAIFTGSSYEVLANGDFNRVPMLLGFDFEEGNYFTYLLAQYKEFLGSYENSTVRLVPRHMGIKTDVEVEVVGNLIKAHYFNENHALTDPLTIHYTSDDQFVRPIREFVRLVSKEVPVYYYKFSYVGATGDPNRQNKTGVGHSEELNYLFRMDFVPDRINAEDSIIRKRLVRLWMNFVKTGNPTPHHDQLLQETRWTAATNANGLMYLDIGQDLEVKSDPNAHDMHFWDQLYEKYGHPPYETY